MSEVLLVIAGLFLPLFPLSMVFNEVFSRIQAQKLRIVLLVIWPQIGIILASMANIDIPGWIIAWALFTSFFYGFRAVALREVGLWTSFIATSSWAILWLVLDSDSGYGQIAFYALAFSAPLALLILLCGELEKRFGAAYTDLYGGLAETVPRLSGVLVFVVLAVIASPLFPNFTAMLAAITNASAGSFVAAATVGCIWLIWSWAGARLLQGLIVGPAHEEKPADLEKNCTWVYVAILSVLVISGIYSIGCLA